MSFRIGFSEPSHPYVTRSPRRTRSYSSPSPRQHLPRRAGPCHAPPQPHGWSSHHASSWGVVEFRICSARRDGHDSDVNMIASYGLELLLSLTRFILPGRFRTIIGTKKITQNVMIAVKEPQQCLVLTDSSPLQALHSLHYPCATPL